ncbi:fatty acid desaturase family protein [Umezawaea beigongshangensis]|uniref:fatty acid desaturase family protein n=1 Tax=Umezawaea beigongshangensis TaxID=2780383 RepID=UPI001E59FD6A|nr:acyl-CoA desaturase [Umezawaea beigongshangensis]
MTIDAAGRRGSDFAELSKTIKQAGLLDRRPGYYGFRLAGNALALVAVIAAVVWLGDSWWQLLAAVALGVVFTQLAFLGHDAGHRQIFAGGRGNEVLGYLHGNLFVGISYGWWMGKHNRHHANPNHEDEDPDVDISVLAFTTEQSLTKRGVFRFIAKHQAFFFFPLLLLEGFSLHVISVAAVLRRDVKAWRLELALLLAHFAAYSALVLLTMSPARGVLFVVVHQAVFGLYMGCSFAPNHKGMPVLTAEHQFDFLRKQVLTSRNVHGNWFTDLLLGGLNYQIEHHLFPSMPRPNLRRAQVLVHEFCRENSISYAQCGLLRSYGHVLEYLHEASAPLRGAAALARPTST